MGGVATVGPPQQDQFAALGAQFEPAAPAPGKQQDPFASLGAQFEAPPVQATPQAQPATPTPAIPPAQALHQTNQTVAQQLDQHATTGTTLPPMATIGAAEPQGWGSRVLDLFRNSPLGHAIQEEFPGAPDWAKPTTKQGTEEYQAEKQGPRFEQLVHGVTQPEVETALTAARSVLPGGAGAPVTLPKGTFRASTSEGETPTEQKLTGLASGASDLVSAPSVAQQIGIAAGIELVAPALVGTLAARLATKGITPELTEKAVHTLVGAGFTAQMATGAVQQFHEYQKAKASGDERTANQILGGLVLNGVMTGLGGIGTGLGAHTAFKELRAGERAPSAIKTPETSQPAESSQPAKTSQPQEAPQPGSDTLSDTPAAAAPAPAADPFAALGAKFEEPAKNSNEVPRGTTLEEHPPIGETEQDTGRTVLQQSPRPEVTQAAATAEHPAIKDTLDELTKPIDGAEIAGARAEKDEERLDEKMDNEGQSPRTVRDYSGFRIAVDSPEAKERVVQALRSKFEVPDESDEFDKGAEETGFHGHTLQVREPGSPVTHEVQVLPREVAEAADDRHGLYEKAREGDEQAQAQLKAANETDWQKFTQRNSEMRGGRGESPEPAAGAEPKFKFGSTQANIPEDSEAAQALKSVRDRIAPEDRAGNVNGTDGGMETQPHVTVRYGIQGEDTAGIRRFIESQAPFEASLGKTDSFPPSEHSDGAAPIIAPVEAPELHRIEAQLGDHGDFAERSFPEYKPHATLGYVKAEAAPKYTGMDETEGKKFLVRSISISDRNGNIEEIPLKGVANASSEPGATGVHQRQPEEDGVAGDGRGRVEPGQQGAGPAQTRGLFGGEEEAPRPTAASEVKPNSVARVAVSELNADPKRFQYKMSATSEAGTTDLLKGRKWNDALAGVISVWRDPADDKVYVVNGHHRFELASSSSVPHMNVLMLDAPDAETARSIGALQNIAEGRGTPMDAAKFFRDSGYAPADLDRVGVSMGEATAANGIALSRLDDRLFDDVVTGKLRQNRAIAIGKATDKPEEQEAILKIIDKAESRGRKVADDTIDELARMAKGAGTHTETQQTLFGAQEMTRNLALEKAEVSSYIRDQIGKEKRLFGSVADEGKAGRLAEGGNKINAAKNRKIAESAAQAQELYDRLSTKAGRVDDILGGAAQDLATGTNATAVKQRAYEEIRASLSKTLGEPAGGEPEGLRAGAGRRQEELPAAAQRSQGLKAPAPPERGPKPEKWEKGERFLVRDPATGNWKSGEVTYYNEGINGAKPGGRSKIGDDKLDEIPRDAMRIKVSQKAVRPIAGTDFEREIIDRTKANLPRYVADYLEKFTEDGVPTLATDAAKELYPEFKADPTGTDRETASGGKAIRDSALETVLSQPVDPKKPNALITTASPGSGKTTGQSGGGNPPSIGVKIEAIADNYKSFKDLLQQVIDSGRRPVVNWVYVDEPSKTVRRMFLRAIGHEDRPGIGRTVQLKYMAEAYSQLPRVLERLRDEYGDKVDFRVVDNSGPAGTATVTKDIQPYIDVIKQKTYTQVLEEMQDETRKLQAEGRFGNERGQAILKAAEANDPVYTGSDQGSGSGSNNPRAAGDVGSGGRESQRPEVSGSVLETPQVPAHTASQEAGGSVSPEEFKAQLGEARKRSLRENIAAQQARVVDGAGGKAVVMDPDAYAAWFRAGLGEKTAWRGMSLPRALANKVEVMLRSMAGSARSEAGGAEAAAGYDRMVKAFREGRNEDGGVTLLRGDYRPDTVLEEAWHNWQRANRIQDSDAMRMVAQRPEVKEIADRLREMGYGVKPGIEGRTELAMEMMAKALAGDPDLKITPEQRYDLVHSFLSEAIREFGPEALKEMPGVTPEAEAALADARRTYAEPDEAGRGGPARGEAQAGGEAAEGRPGVGERSLPAGREGEPAAGGDERRAPKAGQAEDQLSYQRARRQGVRAEDSLALPGMEAADTERTAARGEAEAKELTERMRTPLRDISRAAGEMERNSPLFFGTGDNQTLFEMPREPEQGALFQRPDSAENPVARSVQDLVDAIAREPRDDSRTALEKASDFAGRVYEQSTGRAAKTIREVPTRLENAWAQAKLITASLVDGFRHPLKATDWKRSVGQMDLARAETALKLRDLGRQIKDAAPDPATRIGITHWIEAGGDPRKLDEWALQAKQRWEFRRGDPNIDPRLKNHLADAVKHYEAATRLTPEQKALGMRIKQHFDDMLQLAKANGLLEYGARNYVRHIYEAADAADLVRLLDTSEISPNPGFIEKRVFQNYFEAENHGMIPRNKDIGYLVTAYDKSFNQALASRGMMRSLLEGRGSDGRPLAAIRLRGKWLMADEKQRPLVLQQQERPNSLTGYKYLDHAPTRNFLFEPTVEDLQGFEHDPKLFEGDPDRLAFKGDLVFHPEVANRIDDMLTPGWFDRNENVAQKIGGKVLRGSALAKELMTMVAPFHMVQLAEHSIEHWVNPVKLPEIDLSGRGEDSRLQRLLASNGLGLMDFDAEGLFSARTLKGLAEGVPGLNVAMDAVNSLSRWQFEDVIPRMKMKMARTAFDRNWKSYGSKLEAEELARVGKIDGMSRGEVEQMAHERAERMVAELTAKQANAAFGNLNTAFDSIHRSKTFKQMLRLTMFAPDFLESRIRYTGQAFTRYGGEQRMALLRGALGMYVIARVANAMLNKGDTKNDLEHAFTVVAGGRNFSLRSQEGDILHLINDPRSFIYNRINPLTVRPIIEYLSGRDQFGRQKTGTHVLEDTAKGALPMAVQKIIQTPDESWLNSLLSSTGVITSNYRSPAEEVTHKLYLRSLPDLPDDPEKQAQSRANHQLEEAVREGKKKPGDVIEQAKEGKMTLRQAWNVIDRSQHSSLYNEFTSGGVSIVPKHAGDASALDIYAKATPAERMELRPALIEKGENQLPDIRRQAPASRADIRALEKEWDEQAKLDPKFKRPSEAPDSEFEVLAARWRALLASTPHEEGVPATPGSQAPNSAVAAK